jgi:hypothetical protein
MYAVGVQHIRFKCNMEEPAEIQVCTQNYVLHFLKHFKPGIAS